MKSKLKPLKNIFLFIVTFFVFQQLAIAQKSVNEATLSYTISIQSVSDKPSLSKSLDGATLTVYLKGTESRSDMVSALGTETNIYDSKAGKGVILKEYSGQKLMITMSKENWAQKNQYFQNMNFSTENTEQKIAGFTCRKATAKLDDGKSLVVYYMPDVLTVNKDYNNAFRKLPGVPVQYEIESGKLKFTYTLTNISYDNIPEAKFNIPKTGFRVMTYDENQQLKKG